MAERYIRLWENKKINLYVKGSPILIVSDALTKDSENERVFAQVRFRNLSKEIIRTLTVDFQQYDSAHRPLEDTVTKEYLDLNITGGGEFGAKVPVWLDDKCRAFDISVREVVFQDGKIWVSEEKNAWSPVPKQKNLEEYFQTKELFELYRREYRAGKYLVPQEYEDLWLCRCGYPNKKESTTCGGCNIKREKIFSSINEDALYKKLTEYRRTQEAKKKEEEYQEEQKRKLVEQRKKNTSKLVKIISSSAVACIAFLIILMKVIIPTSKYNAAVALMDEEKYNEAIAAFEAMDGYRDSKKQIEACYTALKDIDYNAAVALMDEEKYNEAIAAFEALNGYKDSETKASEIFDQYMRIAEVGDTVFFGEYEQDNDTSNGKEDIEWFVLAKENGKVLVVSKYALDCQRYNSSHRDVTWEDCSLRKWLNGTFLNNAFSADEQAKIETTNVSADKNPKYSTDPGKATSDKVFLLSITEAEKYFSSDGARQCKHTKYAAANGAYIGSNNGTCWWWLRSPGYYQFYAAPVNNVGSISCDGNYVDSDLVGVRPALWINIE